jgi:hypothetical protein
MKVLTILVTTVILLSGSMAIGRELAGTDMSRNGKAFESTVARSLALMNAIRPRQWETNASRRVAHVMLKSDKDLVVIELLPNDELTRLSSGGQSEQVFVCLWGSESNTVLQLPVSPLSLLGLEGALGTSSGTMWDDWAVTAAHITALRGRLRAPDCLRASVPPTYVLPMATVERERQVTLLSQALREALTHREVQEASVIVREFGEFDDIHIGAVVCDGKFHELSFRFRREAQKLGSSGIDLRLTPVDRGTYDRACEAVGRMQTMLVGTYIAGRQGHVLTNNIPANPETE